MAVPTTVGPNAIGAITVNAPFTLAPGGTLTLVGAAITIDGAITAPGASVNIGNLFFDMPSNNRPGTPTINGSAGITLTSNGAVNVAGTVDQRRSSIRRSSAPWPSSTAAVFRCSPRWRDHPGSRQRHRRVERGRGHDDRRGEGWSRRQHLAWSATSPWRAAIHQNPYGTTPITLDGTLLAYGVTGGGTLSIQAPSVLITDSRPCRHPAWATCARAVVLPARLLQLFGHRLPRSDGLLTGATMPAVSVASGTIVNVVEPTYQFTSQSPAAADRRRPQHGAAGRIVAHLCRKSGDGHADATAGAPACRLTGAGLRLDRRARSMAQSRSATARW